MLLECWNFKLVPTRSRDTLLCLGQNVRANEHLQLCKNIFKRNNRNKTELNRRYMTVIRFEFLFRWNNFNLDDLLSSWLCLDVQFFLSTSECWVWWEAAGFSVPRDMPICLYRSYYWRGGGRIYCQPRLYLLYDLQTNWWNSHSQIILKLTCCDENLR